MYMLAADVESRKAATLIRGMTVVLDVSETVLGTTPSAHGRR